MFGLLFALLVMSLYGASFSLPVDISPLTPSPSLSTSPCPSHSLALAFSPPLFSLSFSLPDPLHAFHLSPFDFLSFCLFSHMFRPLLQILEESFVRLMPQLRKLGAQKEQLLARCAAQAALRESLAAGWVYSMTHCHTVDFASKLLGQLTIIEVLVPLRLTTRSALQVEQKKFQVCL